jgi:hypothetical protein
MVSDGPVCLGIVLDLAAVIRMGENEKDLEILLLRQQLRIVERKQARGPQIPRWQKVPLAVLAVEGTCPAWTATGNALFDRAVGGTRRSCSESGPVSKAKSQDDHP